MNQIKGSIELVVAGTTLVLLSAWILGSTKIDENAGRALTWLGIGVMAAGLAWLIWQSGGFLRPARNLARRIHLGIWDPTVGPPYQWLLERARHCAAEPHVYMHTLKLHMNS